MTPSNTDLTFLVVSNHPVIALDIAEAVKDEIPGSQVIVARSSTEAIGQLDGVEVEKVDVAFIDASTTTHVDLSLLALPILSGARIVLIGADGLSKWEALPNPFNTDDLRRFIKRPDPSLLNKSDGSGLDVRDNATIAER